MKIYSALALLAPLWIVCPVAAWQQPYQGTEATGPHVIGLWRFDAQDAESNSDITLRGQTRLVAEGRFGGALESFAGTPDEKGIPSEGAVVGHHGDLSPAGAWTLELWFKAKPELDPARQAFLIDKKRYHYSKPGDAEANHDYALLITKTSGGYCKFQAWLGYGEGSVLYESAPVLITFDQWDHVAFTYDGAGRGSFFFNGRFIGRTRHESRGPVAAGHFDLHIGGRAGGGRGGFPGFIDEVRLSRGIPSAFLGEIQVATGPHRTAFVRMEPDAAARVQITNYSDKPLLRLKAVGALVDESRHIDIERLAPDQTIELELPLDTALRAGAYLLQLTVTGESQDGQSTAIERTFPIHIVNRNPPERMPVILWGFGELDRLKYFGFTHTLIRLSDYHRIWFAGEPTTNLDANAIPDEAVKLDQYLVEGIRAIHHTYPARWVWRDDGGGGEDVDIRDQYLRIDREGKANTTRPNICGHFPELSLFCYNTGASLAQTFGHFPAIHGALINTEVRDSNYLCFHQHDRDLFRAHAGHDIPDQTLEKRGVQYSTLAGFPSDRIIADDDPILTYYRWFWKDGDGWNRLHSEVSRGLHTDGRKDQWTFFDPAVRVPSVWGSGGEVDVISHWTYTYPDPLKIGLATDELFAMASGRSDQGQQVMKMTQILWYRSQTAPDLPEDQTRRAQWEKDIPDARFITIAPDSLREAFWTKLARPIRGVMYHGWGSLVDRGPVHAYRFTNARTGEVLRELVHEVVQPLGPTLLNVPDRVADVAILESFSSQMFAGRGSGGWGRNWDADAHLVLQWAHLQPQVLYEESILRDGLDQFKVLVLTSCDVLPRSVADRILAWQRKGGVIVADERLAPGIVPDITINSYTRDGVAEVDKAALQERAAQLRAQLDSLYQRYAESSDVDLVVRCRQYGEADYLFAINDRRTYGSYVGHHRMVMEQGIPLSGTLSLRRDGGHVYDLVAHSEVPARRGSQQLSFDAALEAGDGRVYLISPRKIADLRLDAPAQGQRGQPLALTIAILDDQSHPVAAVIPVKVAILDADGTPAEFSGYYAAKDGKLDITLDPAVNDPAGEWTIIVEELASGLTRQARVQLR